MLLELFLDRINRMNRNNFWACNGFDLLKLIVNAGGGCLVGHLKTPGQKTEMTMSLMWTSAPGASLLLRLNFRKPFGKRFSLFCMQRRREKKRSVGGAKSAGWWRCAVKACYSFVVKFIKDAGSIPAMSTIFRRGFRVGSVDGLGRSLPGDLHVDGDRPASEPGARPGKRP